MSIYFDVREDKNHNIAFVTDGAGNDIIRVPLLNKGTAFSKEERDKFSLNGLLPPRILTMDQQIEKIHKRYHRLGKTLEVYTSCKQFFMDRSITNRSNTWIKQEKGLVKTYEIHN